jgi:hypothetical protein
MQHVDLVCHPDDLHRAKLLEQHMLDLGVAVEIHETTPTDPTFPVLYVIVRGAPTCPNAERLDPSQRIALHFDDKSTAFEADYHARLRTWPARSADAEVRKLVYHLHRRLHRGGQSSAPDDAGGNRHRERIRSDRGRWVAAGLLIGAICFIALMMTTAPAPGEQEAAWQPDDRAAAPFPDATVEASSDLDRSSPSELGLRNDNEPFSDPGSKETDAGETDTDDALVGDRIFGDDIFGDDIVGDDIVGDNTVGNASQADGAIARAEGSDDVASNASVTQKSPAPALEAPHVAAIERFCRVSDPEAKAAWYRTLPYWFADHPCVIEYATP